MAKITPFLETNRKTVPSAVAAYLGKKGVAPGNESLITIQPVRAGSNSVGPNVSLEVTVSHRNKAIAPWAATLTVGSSIADTNDTTSARLAKGIIDELVKAGFVAKD